MKMYLVDLSEYDDGEFLRLSNLLKNYSHTITPLYDPAKCFIVSWDDRERPVHFALGIPDRLVSLYKP